MISSFFSGLTLALGCLVVFVLFVTTTSFYAKHCFKISVALSLFLCSISLLATANLKASPHVVMLPQQQQQQQSAPFLEDSSSSLPLTSDSGGGNGYSANDVSPAGLYAIYLAITLLLYTAVPLPLYATVAIAVTYSVLFELLLHLALPERAADDATLAVNALLHVCLHVIGIHTLITTQVRYIHT